MMDRQTEITVSDGGAEVAKKTVPPGEYVVGREPACDLCVDVETVSGRHARLVLHDEEALVEDLGSAGGTFVDGQRIAGTAKIEPGQQVQIGSAVLQLRPVSATPDHLAASVAGVPTETLPFSQQAERVEHAGSDQATIPPPESLPAFDGRAFLEAVRRGRRYEVGHVVARGGMGAILDAKESPIERTVAMKVMLDAESPVNLARFLMEANVTGQLEHPNIVPVHELGVDEKEQVFYTMKFVRGMTLQKVLRQIAAGDAATIAEYPLAVLLTIFQKVCDAMAFAHSKGVIHRDLKPENIMLGDYGEVLVMDWGLAKVLGRKEEATEQGAPLAEPVPPIASAAGSESLPAAATMEGAILGTLQYMPPEQAKGQLAQLDARSDVYSLGAILYQILTLKPPVEGNTCAVLIKVSTGQIVPPGEHTAGPRRLPHLPGGRVPESLSAVTMKAMATEQSARYQSVLELQRDVQAYQNGFATGAEHASLVTQLRLLIRRHKAVFGTAFAAALLIILLTAGFIIKVTASERKATRNAELAMENEQKATRNAELATENERRATRNAEIAAQNERKAVAEKEATRRALAKSQISLCEAALREQDGPGMQAVLSSVPDDLRDTNWNYLWQRSDTSLATLRSHSTGLITSADPDPARPGVFAIAGMDQWVSLVDVRSGAKLLEFQLGFSGKQGTRVLAISADGQRLAIGRFHAGGIVIHSARDGRKLAGWDTPVTQSLQFSPDGAQLLQAVFGREINLWDSATGRLIWSQAGSGPTAAFDPDGQLVFAAFKTKPRLLSAKDGSLVRQLPDVRVPVSCMAFAPDGTRAWVGLTNGFVVCLDLKNGQILYETRANDKRLNAVAYVRDGDRLATLVNLSGGRRSLQVWDASSGSLLEPLLGGGGGGRGLSVHPRSGELVVSGDVAKAWSLAGRAEKWRFKGPTGRNVGFWKAEDRVFCPARFSCVELLDLQDADPLEHPIWKPAERKGERDWYYLSVSADGRHAAVGEFMGSNGVQLLRLAGRSVDKVGTFQTTYLLAGMALSPSGDRLWVSDGVRDAATGKELLHLHRKTFFSISAQWLNATQVVEAATANAHRGQAGAEEQLTLWDATTGRPLRTVVNPSLILALAVAPDGRWIAEAGADKMVRLRDPATLEVKREFRAHDGAITALAFHPHRPILATGSDDLTIRLWNLDTGRLLEEFRGPTDAPISLAFSPSGRRLACLSGDQTTRIWELQSMEPGATGK